MHRLVFNMGPSACELIMVAGHLETECRLLFIATGQNCSRLSTHNGLDCSTDMPPRQRILLTAFCVTESVMTKRLPLDACGLECPGSHCLPRLWERVTKWSTFVSTSAAHLVSFVSEALQARHHSRLVQGYPKLGKVMSFSILTTIFGVIFSIFSHQSLR